MRVARRDDPDSFALEIWMDSALRLSPRALDALQALENEVLSSGGAVPEPGSALLLMMALAFCGIRRPRRPC